ncbi:hypothetical protein [Psychrobacillus sp.]|uniref:hypothetical protein n=1 Tax=Psychrobacillus sp. TaxID=1871623 RepID=UPI0028BD7BFE|nr:hypothetical protein [Psychrobacillus sp.]
MKKRIEILDALRGFSFLGILIANMLYFQYGNATLEAIQPDTWWDKIAYYFTKIFVEGSFIPILGFYLVMALFYLYVHWKNVN